MLVTLIKTEKEPERKGIVFEARVQLIIDVETHRVIYFNDDSYCCVKETLEELE